MATTSKNTADRRKKDAMELALLLYDMFKESQINGNVDDDNGQNNADQSVKH